ncbi:hypothetical protein EYC08_05595 [Tabrizicola sp. WMC-M-20]|nr:hypothetical protein EYC08_05595 [Tabrizicola sp. WMC-M-20]
MALVYDFDIFRIVPDFGPSDPGLAGLLKDVSFAEQHEAATVALFRDPRTAGALRRAPSGLRSYLLDSGFGLNTYSSGAPAGRYPASDEAARLELIQRLAENAHRFALPRPEDTAEGGDMFRLGAFLQALDESQPVDMSGVDDVVQDQNTDQSAGPVVPRQRALPPLFETEPFADASPIAATIPTRRKFWQSRFFRIGAAAVLVLGAMQMVSGPALTVIASL